MRTIEIKEISFEVEKEKQKEVVGKIKEFYPDLKVGVSDIPFDTDDISEEGLDLILGIDFTQEAGLRLS